MYDSTWSKGEGGGGWGGGGQEIKAVNTPPIIIIIIRRIIITLRGAIPDFNNLLHTALQTVSNTSSNDLGTIVCKSLVNKLRAYHAQHVVCHLVGRDSSADKYDKS